MVRSILLEDTTYNMTRPRSLGARALRSKPTRIFQMSSFKTVVSNVQFQVETQTSEPVLMKDNNQSIEDDGFTQAKNIEQKDEEECKEA